jgi:hypothetical protein
MRFRLSGGLTYVTAATMETDMETTTPQSPDTIRDDQLQGEIDADLRELDHRTSDGIEVRLLWNPKTDVVWVAVEDRRLGRSLAFEVDGAEARSAFHHPYVYAPSYEAGLLY